MPTSDKRAKLRSESVTARLGDMPLWKFTDESLVREFKFPTFRDAVAFIVRLGFDAEERDHHPDLDVRYRKVLVRWSTHSDGGVTEKDFAGAQQSDKIAQQLGGQ